jgi:hypothetical protein
MQKNVINRTIAILLLSGTFNAYAQNSNDEIKYNPNAANLNSEKTIAPNQSPAGLPNDSNNRVVNKEFNDGNISNIQKTITILNTPNNKIREIHEDFKEKGRVINEVGETAPKENNDVITFNLGPNSVSPVIRTYQNRTTTLTFTDMYGKPWPIINFDGLSNEDYTIKRLDNPAPDGYILSITPKGANVSGNLVLVLKGLLSPISINFNPGRKEIDGTKEVRIMTKGPNSQMTTLSLSGDNYDNSLLSILQGVPPEGATALKTSSQAVQAWKSKDGSMYVRTRYKIMSPAFESVTTSPDGTYAYKMVPVPIVLYKTIDSRFGEFKVEGF